MKAVAAHRRDFDAKLKVIKDCYCKERYIVSSDTSTAPG